MAGGKETPRQKMIGMMYLVLTALLALNVSKEILHAFVIMNQGLQVTNENIEEKNSGVMAKFQASMGENPAKTKPYFDQASEVRRLSKEAYNYIEQIKGKIISKTDGLPIEQVLGTNAQGFDTTMNAELINGKDNYDVPSQSLGLAEPGTPVTADDKLSAMELKQNLWAYRDVLMAMIPEKKREASPYNAINKTFECPPGEEHGEEIGWEQQQFYHMPLAACIANLSKMQVDIRNAESDMLKFLYGQVDAASFKFNKLEAAVIAPKAYLLTGETYTAKVFLAAYDSTQMPRVTIGSSFLDSTAMTFGADTLGADALSIKGGMGIVSIPATSEGIFTLKGRISIKSPEGGYVSYPVSTTYQVAKPSFTVSPTKMNVFYKGVDNPVSVSAPGVPADKLKVSISNGSISKSGKDGYIVKVKTGNKAVVSVSAMMEDGTTAKLGPGIEFRVKTVPDPKPYFAGLSTGDDRVKKKDLTAAQGVVAKMENFDFDLKFTVISFNMTMMIGGQPIEKPSNSNRVTGDMKTMLGKAKPGSKVYFEKIKARGPDGTVRNLGSLAFKVI